MPRVLYCKEHKHYPDEALSLVYDEESYSDFPDRYLIAVDREGFCKNRFDDGTIGVPGFLKEQAEEDDSPYCREHMVECEWRNQPA